MNAVAAAIGSCALAALAAAIGWRYTPARRTARNTRRQAAVVAELRALNLRRTRLLVEGKFACDPNLWPTFYADHGLDDVERAAAEGGPDA